MNKLDSGIVKYPITRQVEALISLASVTSQKFYDVIGHALEPERMPSPDAKSLITAAHAVAKSGDGGCGTPEIVVQRLRTMNADGKITYDTVKAAEDLINYAKGLQFPDVDSLISEVTPIVKRFILERAIEQTIKDYGKGPDIAESATDRFSKISSLGKHRESLGQTLSLDIDQLMKVTATSSGDRLTTGILEIDQMLNGGVERKTLTVINGGTGDGKSLLLSQTSVQSNLVGYNVAYCSLELSEESVLKRAHCDLLDMSVTDIQKNPEEAKRRLSLIKSYHPNLGKLFVKYESPRVTTTRNVFSWVKDIESKFSLTVDVLIVDYADKLVSKINTEKHMYEDRGLVYDSLRNFAVERNQWVLTASQIKSGSSKKSIMDTDDVADSSEKARISDVMIFIMRSQQDKELEMSRFSTAKNREDRAHVVVGPLPRDEARGRIAPALRIFPWDLNNR